MSVRCCLAAVEATGGRRVGGVRSETRGLVAARKAGLAGSV